MDKYILHIPANTKNDAPVVLPGHVKYIDVIIGQYASTILHHVQETSAEITITLESHAQVEFEQTLAEEYSYETTLTCYQKNNSTFNFTGRYCYSINATLNLFLQGQHANATASCIINAQNSTQSSFKTLQLHSAAYTKSSFLLKGLLQDYTRSTHTGMIRIDSIAHHSHATLQSRYLLIGNHAQAYAQPQLEVLNRQVECYHGSAIGSCDDNDLFYLATRGLDKERAQKLICDAFLSVPDGL